MPLLLTIGGLVLSGIFGAASLAGNLSDLFNTKQEMQQPVTSTSNLVVLGLVAVGAVLLFSEFSRRRK